MNNYQRYQTIQKIFQDAKKRHQAIPGFNFDSLEIAKGISQAAKIMNYPVLLMCTGSAAQSLEFAHAKNIAKQICNDNPLVISHWDHIFDYQRALELITSGFDSVMYDGSKLDYTQNLANSSHFVKLARTHNVITECEIGKIGGKEDDENLAAQSNISPQEAINFYQVVQPDLFAFALGTSHGLNHKVVQIAFDNIGIVNQQLPNAFLVLHGGSGVPKKDLQQAIHQGIVKLNVGTSLKKVAIEAMQQFINNNPQNYDIRQLNAVVIEAVKLAAITIIELCQGK